MELQRKQNKQEGDKKYDLPEPIIQKILSVLEPKDAAKSRFLSKTWQRALTSFPCIHLDESDFNAKSIEHPNNYPLKNEEIRKKKKAFMTYIDNTLQSRLEHTSSLEVEEFTLKLTYHDKEFVLPRVVK